MPKAGFPLSPRVSQALLFVAYPNAMTLPQICSVDDAVERLSNLHVGVVGTTEGRRHARPHKAVLLLGALDLIADGQATAEGIPWSNALRRRFAEYFAVVRAQDDRNTPENPFRGLQTDAIWKPVEVVDGQVIALNREPLVGECDTGRVRASLSSGFERFVLTPSGRTRLRNALVERFFPGARGQLEPFFRDAVRADRVADPAAEETDDKQPSGRSQGFRRKVLEIYDFQCAACGLRINIPEVLDGTFIDAAHLIPFSESRNDHPTNGLALCKNHHWAMDRYLIAPSIEGGYRRCARLSCVRVGSTTSATPSSPSRCPRARIRAGSPRYAGRANR